MVSMADAGPTSSMRPEGDSGGASRGVLVVPPAGPGDRLGDFVLTRLLGVGGMGAVYEAV